MRTLNRALLLVVVFGLWSPQLAAAGAWEWLERLSGPGPFYGVSEDVPLMCQSARPTKTVSANASLEWREPLEYGWHCWNQVTLPAALHDPSIATAHGSRAWHVSLYVARLATDDNELPYTSRPANPGVVVWRVGPRFTWHAHRYFDLHTGLAFNHYSSKSDAFDPFWRTSAEVLGLTWRPFAGRDTPFSHVTFPVRSNLLLSSIDAADLGATGSFKTGREVQFSAGIAFDVFTR